MQVDQRLQQRLDLVVDEALGAGGDLVARRAGQLLVGEQDDARPQRIVAGDQRGDRRADPAQRAVRAERDVAVGAGREAVGARLELGRQRLLRGGLDRLGVLAAGRLVGGEAEALQLADMMAFDEHCRRRG